MLATKNLPRCERDCLFRACPVSLRAARRPVPRALLKGKKLLERGDYAAAVAQFKTATTLLATNAQAWNYLGVACQYAGQPADAAAAYQRALTLDRDLVEAHYNLGCLWLEQNKPDAARTRIHRLHAAPQQCAGRLAQARPRRSFNRMISRRRKKASALRFHLSPNNAEALNGLGLARVERGRPQEAAQFFAAAQRSIPITRRRC